MVLLGFIVIYLYAYDAWSADNYVRIQKETFLYFNLQLSKFPLLMYNLTQLGDALIILSLCTALIVYAPKIWESLIFASLVSALLCCPFKWLFKIPRPAAILEKDSFIIIGKTYVGNNSLPSGHAITVFTVLTVLLWALLPKNTTRRIIWITLMVGIGTLLSLSRVGVGAHHLLDVMIGSIIGYLSGISGILISRNLKIGIWIDNKKFYSLLIILFIVWSIVVIMKIQHDNLLVFYFSLLSLLTTIYIITRNYVKK
ncbi:phosphatase PAP2 family protein [Chryseobacterium proteolyticum]|uniref:phosphatase PAP2 family protein n=1 Tax=Chryseobacterium proteolyticum TaxID=118127 RepID=UPI003982F721